jgi:hypothetical protein
MKIEKLLKYFLFGTLILGIILPVAILLLAPNNSAAGEIGDALGGTTAPFVNIAAILVILLTYMYQKRTDRRKEEKELINSIYQDIKDELSKVKFKVTVTSKGIKEEKIFNGADAIRETVRNLNNEMISLDDVVEYDHYDLMINIYKYFNSFLGTLKENESLTANEKALVLAQFSLFYRNNLRIGKEQRGDELCKFHNKMHRLPGALYDQIIQIENKII